MVRFDELRITPDKENLVIECHVEDYDVYSKMYIQTVYLEYYKNRGTVGVPSDKAILLFENDREDPTAVRSFRKRVNLDALPGNFGTQTFSDGLFYVYVVCDGNLPASVSTMYCGFDVPLDVAVIPDWKALYDRIMPLVARFAMDCSPCEVPANFEHLILLWNAFRFAVDTCDWLQVDRLWDKLMGTQSDGYVPSGCGCRG